MTRAISILVLAALTLPTAAQSPLRARADRPPEGLPTLGQGAAAEAVLPGPQISGYYRTVDPIFLLPEHRPEAFRNDRHLSYRPSRPFRAVDAWPQPGIPRLEFRRTFTLSRNARTITYFSSGPAYGSFGVVQYQSVHTYRGSARVLQGGFFRAPQP